MAYDFGDIFEDFFNPDKQTSRYRYERRMDIVLRKSEYEKHLDKMWSIYGKGVTAQIVEYNKQLESIKSTGCKVYRNSAGKHKIVVG